MALQPPQQTAGPSGQHRQPQVFEFTKRKRWADILISELPETINLVLSTNCKVLYCGTAVTELLGWGVEDLVDGDLTEFINDDDLPTFTEQFQGALQARQEFFTYLRLKCKGEFVASPTHSSSSKELLFEIVGHPYYIPDDHECKCIFAMAKLYPSRNNAVLNTFLELKMENERLAQRLVDLRAQIVPAPGSMPPPLALPSMCVPSQMYNPSSYSLSSSRMDDIAPSPTRSAFDVLGMGGYGSAGAASTADDHADDESRKNKKLKKTPATDNQYVCVTCGRTDSPEWRKGPLGPKTLCNACGLRWSKKSRKVDDPPVINTVPPPLPPHQPHVQIQMQQHTMPNQWPMRPGGHMFGY
ncbi:hypothetical protein BD410DRAFT_766588 [Rickenella mellea]|uniref:GATA-domain-containing protein n=1 Tax=Rickenella mellea TaxID=50990 RepID=A0A4Y7QBI1_9AGAM|nr:hypothetical protein BD410DRAFT_766588 [Rickenella mellea]